MKSDISSPLVSILMPVYNAADYLHACLESIAKQSCTDWELIAVDDFSEDTSFEILETMAGQWKQEGKKLTVLRNTQKGIIPALRLAYDHACGTFISRMDADDLMPESKLKDLQEVVAAQPEACVTAKVRYFSDGHLANGFIRYADWLNSLIDQKNHYQAIYKECIVPSPCWMMHRKTLELIGGLVTDRYPEDYDLCFRLYEHRVPIIGLPKILHWWRDHGTRASRNDPNYANQHFLQLKLHYFKKLETRSDRPLILWGAGKTGKLWAKALRQEGMPFRWMTGNDKKIGHIILDQMVESEEALWTLEKAQIICAIKERAFADNHEKMLRHLEAKNDIYYMY